MLIIGMGIGAVIGLFAGFLCGAAMQDGLASYYNYKIKKTELEFKMYEKLKGETDGKP